MCGDSADNIRHFAGALDSMVHASVQMGADGLPRYMGSEGEMVRKRKREDGEDGDADGDDDKP